VKRAWAICKRELKAFFTTPVGYIVIGTFALISGLGFTASFLVYGLMTESPSAYDFTAVPDFEETFLSPFLVYCGTIMMFIGPLITMRLFAEEHNQGTIEMLLTHPLRDREIIAGKYAAGLVLILAMVAVLVIYILIIDRFVAVEPAVLAFGLVAVFFMGAAFVSMGLFISAMCRSQVTAATATFGLFFLFFIVGYFGEDLPEESPVPATWSADMHRAADTVYGVFRAFVQELPVDAHARTMAEGILQPSDIAYYLLFNAFFLFLTFRALESRKWGAKR